MKRQTSGSGSVFLLLGGFTITGPLFGAFLAVLHLYFDGRFVHGALLAFAASVATAVTLWVAGRRSASCFYLFLAFTCSFVIVISASLSLLVWSVVFPVQVFFILLGITIAGAGYDYYATYKRLDVSCAERDLQRLGCFDAEARVFKKSLLDRGRRIEFFRAGPRKEFGPGSVLGRYGAIVLAYGAPYILALSFVLGRYHLTAARLLVLSLLSTLIAIGFKKLLLVNLVLVVIIRRYERMAGAILHLG